MREKPRDKERLEHILEAIGNIDRGKNKYSLEQICIGEFLIET